MKLSVFKDRWELIQPFATSQNAVTHITTLTVCLGKDGICGRGESLGVDYHGEDAHTMAEQLEAVRSEITKEPGFDGVAELLPPGGARNALDCALWDLHAKQAGKRVWEMLDIPHHPVTTVYTLSMDSPERMAAEAAAHARYPALKLKLGRKDTAECLRAIRSARPDAQLVIDANGDWTIPLMDSLADNLLACKVEMLEQPLPPGGDSGLDGLDYPVTLCADESCQSMTDLPQAAGRYGMVNIKLDKCGGFTEAMNMVRWCEKNGVPMMVGNMLGSSLAMAPGFLVAQFCRFVDLDGPLWQRTDRSSPMVYEDALVHAPERALWG